MLRLEGASNRSRGHATYVIRVATRAARGRDDMCAYTYTDASTFPGPAVLSRPCPTGTSPIGQHGEIFREPTLDPRPRYLALHARLAYDKECFVSRQTFLASEARFEPNGWKWAECLSTTGSATLAQDVTQ